MRHAKSTAPWALRLASAITLLAMSEVSPCTAEDFQPASTIRFLGEGVRAAAQTSPKNIARSEGRQIEEPVAQRPTLNESPLRSPSTGKGRSTLTFRMAQPSPESAPGSQLRLRPSHNQSPLKRPSFTSYVEYRGTHLEWGRMRPCPVAPPLIANPLATVVTHSADETVQVVSHDAQASDEKQILPTAAPLRPAVSEIRVLSESIIPPEKKVFYVRRLPRPGDRQPRLQLDVGG